MNFEINFINKFYQNRFNEKIRKINEIESFENPNFKPYRQCTEFYEGSIAINFFKYKGFYELSFCASDSEDLTIFFKTIKGEEFKDLIISLLIFQPNEQANGIFTYDLEELVNNVVYKNLKAFKIQQFSGGFSNLPELYDSHSGDNMIFQKLLNSMPNLNRLYLPNSPNESFFNLKSHQLKLIDVQLFVHENQHFLSKLSKSTVFNELKHLRITEAFEPTHCFGHNISNEEYLDFFENSNILHLKTVELRNVTFDMNFANKLKNTKLGKQLKRFLCSYGVETAQSYNSQVLLESNETLGENWRDDREWESRIYY